MRHKAPETESAAKVLLTGAREKNKKNGRKYHERTYRKTEEHD